MANPAAARRALRKNGAVVRVKTLEDGVAAVNTLAAEHVEVLTRRADRVARDIVGAAVFVGPWSPVAVGDYGIGPNHVLPTGGGARFSSPLSVRDFQRRQSVVRMTEAGLARVTEDVVRVALAEGFRGHAQSVLTRFEGELMDPLRHVKPAVQGDPRLHPRRPGGAGQDQPEREPLGPAGVGEATGPGAGPGAARGPATPTSTRGSSPRPWPPTPGGARTGCWPATARTS